MIMFFFFLGVCAYWKFNSVVKGIFFFFLVIEKVENVVSNVVIII